MTVKNSSRLLQLMKRADRGEELTIGFFGGSITQGSLAKNPENTYARRVFTWWKDSFPKAEFHYVNGGIGGTTSHYGAARAVRDVLMYQPDFVMVDFCVNDEANDFFQETYEGVIRKIVGWQSKPAVVLLNNVFYDTGKNAQEYHNAVGDWYQIPHISIKDTLYEKVKEGIYAESELTPDHLHPNDFGHGLVAKEVITFLEKIKEEMEEGAESEEDNNELPNPMTQNAYENAKLLTIRECSPQLTGFRADTKEKAGHLDCFKNGWIGKKAGEKISFELGKDGTEEGVSCIAVQYRKTVSRPSCRAQLIIDENRENPIFLDGNFEEDWGDCLYLEPVLHHGRKGSHTIEIEILPQEETGKEITPFYLMALIIA